MCKCLSVFENSSNSCLPIWVLALNLLIRLRVASFCPRRPPHVFTRPCRYLHFRNTDFEMLLWPLGECRILSAPTFFLECLISKCCCASHEAPYPDLRNITSTIATMNILKTNDKDVHQTWSRCFVVLGAHMQKPS